MATMSVNLIKGDKVSSKTDYRDALPVNMFAVAKTILGASGYMLEYPGLTLHAEAVGIDRGGVYNDRLGGQYRVSGGSLVSVSASGAVATLGSIGGAGQASMPYSFNTQCVITNGEMFLYDPTEGFRQVIDEDLGSPIDGEWVDGYYMLTDGEYIYHTDITDESSIDPLKFATAEFMPDKSLGVSKTQDNKIMIWGRYSLEYFVNAATENFAFQRVETRAQKIGIVATHAKCESAGTWFITGGRKEESLGVHAVVVGSSTRVSTREIDKILAEYTEPELEDMRMESVNLDGTTFIKIHLPNETLCFNYTVSAVFGTTYAWTILKSDIVTSKPYRGINGVFDPRLGAWYFGDRLNGNIGLFDDSVATHYDEIVEWILYTPLINIDSASIDQIEIQTIPGHTVTSDATVAFSTTQNGLTYSREYWTLYGEPSDYGQRFYNRQIGYVRDFIGFKLRGASRSRMAFATMKATYG